MTKVLIVDDHAVMRGGLRLCLEETGEALEVAEAANGHEAMVRIRAEAWDVVLLDVNQPGRNGIDLLRRIKAEKPKLPVLALNMHCEERYAVRAIKGGAAGYINRECEPEELATAVRKVAGGGRYISEQVAYLLADHVVGGTENGARPLHELLSDREYEVFLELAAGHRVTDIARARNLSAQAIATNRRRLLDKMAMKTNAELTIYASRHGLLDFPPS